ncbi:MAG: RloB family protein [Coriobacteriia bacterium]|nr:RloB family protein [Coriobacteriia bacterium]
MALSNNRGKQKKRGSGRRKQTSILLLSCEGNNKTEFNYFRGVFKDRNDIRVKHVKGNSTDPVNMVKELINLGNDYSLDSSNNDLAVCLIDLDQKEYKVKQLNRAVREINKARVNFNIEIIVSNPCFEVWYLMHYEPCMRRFSNNSQVITALKEYIPDYEKTDESVYKNLIGLIKTAIYNCKKVSDEHLNNGHSLRSKDCSPYTEVDKLMRYFNVPKNI